MPSKYGADLKAGGSKSALQKRLDYQAQRAKHEASIDLINGRFRAIRASFIRAIAPDPAKRAAWELLTGAVPDWGDPEAPMPPCGDLPDINHNRPDLIIPTAAFRIDEKG